MERETAASKVRLIERAWIEYTDSKRQREQHRQTIRQIEGRSQRNDRMQRLAAGLKLDPIVSKAFNDANADSLVQAQTVVQDEPNQCGSKAVTAAVALDVWWVPKYWLAAFADWRDSSLCLLTRMIRASA